MENELEQFGVKQLQKEFEYTQSIINRVSERMDREESELDDETYKYKLHYEVSELVPLVKQFLEGGYRFEDAFEIAQDLFHH
ncbi:MAG: hypothetical protein P8Y16_08340 [Sulfurimonas sp.]